MPITHQPDENSAVDWINTENLLELISEEVIVPIYRRIIKKVKQLG
jgi:hypothetical protein